MKIAKVSIIRIVSFFLLKTDGTAQYSLEIVNQPIGISEYHLSKFLPDNLKSSLPSIEELEEELKKTEK